MLYYFFCNIVRSTILTGCFSCYIELLVYHCLIEFLFIFCTELLLFMFGCRIILVCFHN